MFFTILAACFKSKSSVFVVQSFTLRGEVNKTGRPVLTGFYCFLYLDRFFRCVDISIFNRSVFATANKEICIYSINDPMISSFHYYFRSSCFLGKY